MKDDEFETPFIEVLPQSNLPLNYGHNYLGFVLFLIMSMIYVTTYEWAGLLSIYRETGEYALPNMVYFINNKGQKSSPTANSVWALFIMTFCIFPLEDTEKKEEYLDNAPLPQLVISILWPCINLLAQSIFSRSVPSELVTQEGIDYFLWLDTASFSLCSFLIFLIVAYSCVFKRTLVHIPINLEYKYTIIFCGLFVALSRFLGSILLQMIFKIL